MTSHAIWIAGLSSLALSACASPAPDVGCRHLIITYTREQQRQLKEELHAKQVQEGSMLATVVEDYKKMRDACRAS